MVSSSSFKENELIIVAPEEAGLRLDKVLAQRYKEVRSRTYFQYLIEQHLVMLNGTPVKKRTLVKEGDEIDVFFALTPEITLTPEDIPLAILFEDDYLLVANKPPGMVVHPAPGNWSGTFVNALLFHCGYLPESSSHLRPGIVHRLDKETSGLLVAAKDALTQQKLVELFASRQVYKEYLAICVGNPGSQDIHTFIGRDPIHRQKMAVVSAGGKEAVTQCRTLAVEKDLSLVKVILLTGRTHQIRVHMRHIGTPVLGDPLYGSLSANHRYHLSRQMLHAHLLKFIHPITGKSLEFKAEMPVDMKDVLKKCHFKDI